MQKRQNDVLERGDAVMGILIIVLVVAIGAGSWFVMHRHHSTTASTAHTAATTSAPASSTTTPLTAGTDNASLQTDLTNINSTMQQSSQDSTSANSAINDQQNEISVPTN